MAWLRSVQSPWGLLAVQSGVGCGDRFNQVAGETGKRTRQGRDSRHKNIVMTGPPRKGQDRRGGRPQTAFGAITLDSAPDFSARRDAEAGGARIAEVSR